MGSRIRCFWLEQSDEIELSLRRFCWSERGKCESSGYGHHDASAIVERTSIEQLRERGWPMSVDGKPVHTTATTIQPEDPRWPLRCACGRQFAADDEWQCNRDTLFKRSDNGELVTLAVAPVGAMWNAYWMGDDYRGPDGIVLCVRTPGGEWAVDGPSYSGGKIQSERGWTRSGAIPDVIANPSILIPGKYHGFLRAGWLEEC